MPDNGLLENMSVEDYVVLQKGGVIFHKSGVFLYRNTEKRVFVVRLDLVSLYLAAGISIAWILWLTYHDPLKSLIILLLIKTPWRRLWNRQ
jgi:hypothetical protein